MKKILFPKNIIPNYKELLPVSPKNLSFDLRNKNFHFANILVQVGEQVACGQVLARDLDNDFALRASLAGTIASIGEQKIDLAVQNGANSSKIFPVAQPQDLASRTKEAGILGMGGGGFPTYRKIIDAKLRIIVNCCECEPGNNADSALIYHFPDQVQLALALVAQKFPDSEVHIALKADNHEIIAIFERILEQEGFQGLNFKLAPMTKDYPIGSDKLLAHELFGFGDFGHHLVESQILSFNIATLVAMARALAGEFLQARVLTVGRIGNAINALVPLGTKVDELLEILNLEIQDDELVISGGAMMGVAIDPQNYSIKAGDTSIFIVKYLDQLATACINCGYCVEVCPTGLYPQILLSAGLYSKQKTEDLTASKLSSCIECGMCSAVCPSNIDLVQHFRDSKKYLNSVKSTMEKNKLTRQRKEARAERLRLASEE